MAMSAEDRKTVIDDHKTSANDTGSCEVQVALLTSRIKYMTDHLKQHNKDFHSRRGLEAMVNRRNKLLGYLRDTDVARYRTLIEKLGLRK